MAPAHSAKRSSLSSTPKGKKLAFPATPSHNKSPMKQRKMKISERQKQALIENLQLEVTERARRLRAQYNLQAQGLRSRVEIRLNRIPVALRKMTMGDLIRKYSEQPPPAATRPPPVPAKDAPLRTVSKALSNRTDNMRPPSRPQKRNSDVFTADKENEIEHIESPKKKQRNVPGVSNAVRPTQVLSPTSSNSRLVNRDLERPPSPSKSHLSRPASPLKGTSTSRSAAATNLLSHMVEKAKSSRVAGRKATNTSNTSSSSNTTAAPAAKTRRAAAPRAAANPPSRPATRMARRASENSETSEGSATTVIRKGAVSRAKTPTSRARPLGNLRKGTAATEAKTKAVPTTTSSGRVLRKRT